MDIPPFIGDPQHSQGRLLNEIKPGALRRLGQWEISAQHEIILTLLLVLCYGFFRQIPLANEYSRYYLVLALVDDHTTRIDPYHENTGDTAFYNGHYYSNKAPGSALLVAPSYALVRGVSYLAGADPPDPDFVMQMLTFTAAGLPTVLLAILLLRFLRPLVGEPWALTMVVAYALGTIAFPFATMYFGHAASAFFLFAAFYLLWRARENHRVWTPLLAGIMAGWAVLTEYPTALGVAVLFVYCLRLGRQSVALFIVGGLPLLAVLLGYNWISFDHPFRLGYQYATVYAEVHSQGIIGVVWPSLSTLKALLVGPRGLFVLSSWLSLTPLGIWAARSRQVRAEIIVCMGTAVAFLIYNSGFLIPFGGATPGPRFLLPALPFATVLAALVPREFRRWLAVLVALSVLLVLIVTATMPKAGADVSNPLLDLWLPRLFSQHLADTAAWLYWGLHGLQPLWVLVLAAATAMVALYASTKPTQPARRFAAIGTSLLAVLVLCFGTPLDLLGGLQLGAHAADGGVAISIVNTGATLLREANQDPKVELWAQLENRGQATETTMVTFSIFDPSGQQVWTEWYRVSWRQRERQSVDIEWSTAGITAGEYRFGIAITSIDRQLTFTSIPDAGHIQVRP